MHRVEPKVFLIGKTEIDHFQLREYLRHIGAEDWFTDAGSEVEEIIEVMGRGCYKSFGTELNPNITRVRTESKAYIENIINIGHGSVLEHAFLNWQFVDVSRVLTHELVRHRPGVAISQESLRFVRADDLGFWLPPAFQGNNKFNKMIESLFEAHFHNSEVLYQEILKHAAWNENKNSFDDLSFNKKKYYTSAARRLLPIGMATNIGWSCNIRTLRHIIESRTESHAEEEIRFVFAQVAEIVIKEWPSLFGDYKKELKGGIYEYSTESRKV